MDCQAQRLIIEWVRIYSATDATIVLDNEELTYLITLIVNSCEGNRKLDKVDILEKIEDDKMSCYDDGLVYYLCDRVERIMRDSLCEGCDVIDVVVQVSKTMANTICIMVTVSVAMKDVYELT